MRNLGRNVRFGLRLLAKNPGFSAVALLALILGIGANTAIFSVVYAVLLAPLPYPHPDQLVMVWSKVNRHRNSVSVGDYLEWKRQNTVFQDLAAWSGGLFNLSVADRPEVVQARITSPNFFSLQGIPFLLGRGFLPDEVQAGRDHVAVITHRLWRERFGGEGHIIGREIRLNNEPYTVIGVLAAGMPDRFESQLFVPLTFTPDDINHRAHGLLVMGRLKPGTSLQQANADMGAVTHHLAEVFPTSNKGWGVSVEPLQHDFTSRDTIKDLWLLLGAVGFVLLIACVNVANLLLVRGNARRREVALRAALGATRWHISAQLLTESVVLGLIGGIGGVGLAWAMLKVILAILPPYSIPTEADVRLSLPVLFFSLAASLVAGALCGCVPAWQSSRWNLSDDLKEAGRTGAGSSRHGLRRCLVALEFALALTLLSGAGLMIHSFWKLTRVDLGFRPDHTLTFQLPIPDHRFASAPQTVAFYRQLLSRIEALPGIESASVSTGMPIEGTTFGLPFEVAGRPASNLSSRPQAGFTPVSPEYFRTLGIQITRGRSFTEQDTSGSLPVAIVNETFRKKYLANVDPLTQRVIVPRVAPGAAGPGEPIEWQIVGVYRDVHNEGVRGEGFPEINVPFWQSPWPRALVQVRTAGEPQSAINAITAVVQSMDSSLALNQVRTMDQVVDETLAGDRFATVLFSAFAAVALLLAAIGIYGVMSFVVTQRTHEIGLRMALGARPAQLLELVLREGMALAAVGLLLGLGGAYLVGLLMKSVLYEVSPADPASTAAVAAVLLISALLACYLPARRATEVDPMVALRDE